MVPLLMVYLVSQIFPNAYYSRTPLKRPANMVAFQKGLPVMRGKIYMICKEWCIEIDQFLQL